MLKKERQAHILHQVRLHNRVAISDLSVKMRASEDTIRRDLQEMHEDGLLIKIHGGALSHSFHSSLSRSPVYSQEQKRTAAEKLIPLIKPGMFVLTSGGTTIIEMAQLLPPDLHAHFLTPSLPAMMAYMQHPLIEPIFIGSKVSKASMISVGGDAIARLKEIRADICILGVNAISAEYGITDNDWEVVQVKRAMIESSEKLIAITIAEKVNTREQILVCETGNIDILVTEADPHSGVFDPFWKAGVQVI